SHGFRQLGLVAGDTIALVSRNSRTYFELMLATGQIGLYLTPINYHLAASEISYIVTNSEARAVISDTQALPTCTRALNEIDFPADRRRMLHLPEEVRLR